MTSLLACRVDWRWPPNKPTAPVTGSGSCGSISSAATAGWRPTPTSGRSIGRSCGPWPGSGAPPGSPSSRSAPAMSWTPWGRCPSRPEAGGPGATPLLRSSTTDAATTSTMRTGPSAPTRVTRPSGPTDSGPAWPSSGSTASSAPLSVLISVSRPASLPLSRDFASSVAGQARSGPPASTSRKEASMASPTPHRFPFDDDDRPSGSVQPLSQADLQAILAHLGDDPDQLLAGTGVDRPVVAVRMRASVGRPGGSAQDRWRRLRAAEWAAWTGTLPWRVAALLGIGAASGLLGSLLGPRLGPALGVLAALAT